MVGGVILIVGSIVSGHLGRSVAVGVIAVAWGGLVGLVGLGIPQSERLRAVLAVASLVLALFLVGLLLKS